LSRRGAVRVPWLRDVLTRADADLVGIQELQSVLKDDTGKSEMAQLFPPESGYDYAYYKLQPGDDYLDDYPDPVVAWKKDRFTKLQEGWYWLSTHARRVVFNRFCQNPVPAAGVLGQAQRQAQEPRPVPGQHPF
jgi:hypothetical protein